jgi:Mycothiol maleylpyruvate isomerase N-terminal domain
MATTSPWPLIHAEREALIADLGTLTDEQWATRSLCADWTVRDVLGHMIAKDTTHPPGPVEAMPGEAVIHPADIRKPLGIAHEYPEKALNRVADFYRGSNLIVGAKQRIDGLTLRATDTGWTAGSGPEVTGAAPVADPRHDRAFRRPRRPLR